MSSQQLYFSSAAPALARIITELSPASLLIITDENVRRDVLPALINGCPQLADAHIIAIPPGDEAKNLHTLDSVWRQMQQAGATRRSLTVNIGGGMVTDLGGFAAATFKRGMRFVNVPTTVLATVDAAVGGKTGINFGGLKNEIGAFAPADAVVISNEFFATLPREELLSGYAEMLKHSLLHSRGEFAAMLSTALLDNPTGTDMAEALRRSVAVKENIVAQDPTERGLRKALNLGHTAGHAFEELALHRGTHLPHGYAVAYGLVVAAILSVLHCGFSHDDMHTLAAFVRENYGAMPFTCDDYPALLSYMAHDKKNPVSGIISFTLLNAPGSPKINVNTLTETQITAAFDIYRDLSE